MTHMDKLNSYVARIATATTMAITAPFAAFAADTAKTPGQLLNDSARETAGAAGFSGTTTLPVLVGNFIKQAMALLGIILVVFVIYAGFLWMTAAGNDEKIKKAKAIISSAVIGLVLIFAAYAITGFVIDAITNATGA